MSPMEDDGYSDEETVAVARVPFKDLTKATTNTATSSTASALDDDDFLSKFPSVQLAGTTKVSSKGRDKGKQKQVRPRSIAEYALEDQLLPCLSRAPTATFKKPYNVTPKSAKKAKARPASTPVKRKRAKSLNDVDIKPFALKKVKLENYGDDDDDDDNELTDFTDVDEDDIDKRTTLDFDSVEAEDGTTESTTIDNMDVDLPFPDLVNDINFDVEAMLRQRDKHGEMGDQALDTWLRESRLAMDAIKHLYHSIKNAPEDSVEFDPEGLKVPLMPHQRQALKWMKWRETQKPKGGILADDMGLGKTLQMISLILAAKNEKVAQAIAEDPYYVEDQYTDTEDWGSLDVHETYEGKTLVICPMSLLQQWEREIRTKVTNGKLSTFIYHGKEKLISEKRLVKFDVVISTYQTVAMEYKYHAVRTGSDKDSRIYKIHWDRVILDEAHEIRNHTAERSKALCQLKAARKWLLTGTPIQNREEDFYALLKFLQCAPFDDLKIWNRFINNKKALGNKRLVVICKGLMLRRTKDELVAKNVIKGLPEKNFRIIDVQLDDVELIVYQKLLLYSQGFFCEFLRRRERKAEENYFGRSFSRNSLIAQGVPERLSRVMKALMRHHDKSMNCNFILVLITRLRQICCHPALIKAMLDRDDLELDDEPRNLFQTMSSTVLNMVSRIVDEEDDDQDDDSDDEFSMDASEAKNLMSSRNPVFSDYRVGSKVRAVLNLVDRIIDMGEKVVVVSQWTSFLQVIANNLVKMKGAKFATFCGRTKPKDRQMIVDRLNDPEDDLNVLLLSLTAGAVGLNLVGANHLLLIDLHWNPQLENQAMDRIHRFGQTNNVHIYKFICKDTIEENIKHLQDRKLKIAKAVLTGSVSDKLTIDDLKCLFSLNDTSNAPKGAKKVKTSKTSKRSKNAN